jgi:hypothetical protein
MLPESRGLDAIERCLAAGSYGEPIDLTMFVTPIGRQQLNLTADRDECIMISEISRREDAIDEYEGNAAFDARFRSEVRRLRFFSFVYRNFMLMRRVLRHIVHSAMERGDTAWIDTDYGWVIGARDFFAQTERDPNWDWRRPDPKGDK